MILDLFHLQYMYPTHAMDIIYINMLYSYSRHAYVIELKRVPRGKTFEIDLEIRQQHRNVNNKEFWLVLKSPSHVTWHVRTRKVQGYINIVVSTSPEYLNPLCAIVFHLFIYIVL